MLSFAPLFFRVGGILSTVGSVLMLVQARAMPDFVLYLVVYLLSGAFTLLFFEALRSVAVATIENQEALEELQRAAAPPREDRAAPRELRKAPMGGS